ncbi:MAG TPA: SAM-dependent chlorinase/fluorinase [Trueperaceae bacterium]
MSAPIALLTDFGSTDVYVGVMKAVISGLAPSSQVIDLGHQIPPQDVRAAAAALLFACPYLAAGTVVCCVVDPGVGTERAPLALELETAAGAIYLVCPDNGVVTPLLGSVRRAVITDDPAFHLPRVSATFHGRDVFAPVSAHLASGVELSALGSDKEPGELVTLPWPRAVGVDRGWRIAVVHVDRFGNLITNLEGERLREGRWLVRSGSRSVPALSPTFGAVAVGEPVAYEGSSGFLEIAIRQGNAAAEWGLGVGDELLVERVSG